MPRHSSTFRLLTEGLQGRKYVAVLKTFCISLLKKTEILLPVPLINITFLQPNGVLAYICRLEEDTPVPGKRSSLPCPQTEQFVRLLIANGKGRTLHKAFYSQEGYSGIRGPPNTTKPSFPATDERDAAEQDVCAGERVTELV